MAAPNVITAAGGGRRAAIDQAHLERMTLGDQRLEREVLQIFVRQAAMMLDRIAYAEPATAAAAAHTLLGSARGIGAWRVAQAAQSVEAAALAPNSEHRMVEAVTELKASVLEASAAIGARLGASLTERGRD